MGYQPHIDPDVESWLAEMREAWPEAARQVGEALDALRADGATVGPPLVVPSITFPTAGMPGSNWTTPTSDSSRP